MRLVLPTDNTLQATSHFSGFLMTSPDGEEFHIYWGEGVGVVTTAIPCVSKHTFDWWQVLYIFFNTQTTKL
jgi:hypothetical protein